MGHHVCWYISELCYEGFVPLETNWVKISLFFKSNQSPHTNWLNNVNLVLCLSNSFTTSILFEYVCTRSGLKFLFFYHFVPAKLISESVNLAIGHITNNYSILMGFPSPSGTRICKNYIKLLWGLCKLHLLLNRDALDLKYLSKLKKMSFDNWVCASCLLLIG